MDAVATLIGDGVKTYDEYLNEHIEPVRYDVFVQVRGVYRSEFYDAAQTGLKPSITFMISNRVDYHGETDIEYEGKTYTVIRTDWVGDGVNLTCEEKVNE